MQSRSVPASRGALVRFAFAAAVIGLASQASCGAPAEESVADAEGAWRCSIDAPALDPSRSLMIVDLPTLHAVSHGGWERFSLHRVLSRIAATADVDHPIGPLQLYRRIWDTNNTKAGGYFHDGQHCDDVTDHHGRPVLNGFPLECPRQEGALADTDNHDPFCTGPGCDPYSPIAIVNRFDLAPANGQNCGQYRMIFGKGVGQPPVVTAGNPDPTNRNLIIFEAVLPNPYPHQGLAGCAPAVRHWADLSAVDDPAERARQLDRFFFKGIDGFPAAFEYAHFSGEIDPATGMQLSGQVRSNQFMFALEKQPWQLREYNLVRECKGRGHKRRCSARVRLVPPKINPEARLFDENNHSPRAQSFRDPYNPSGFFGQLADLAIPDLNLLNMNDLPPKYNGAQSTSSPVFPDPETPVLQDSNYLPRFDPAGPFAGKIQQALDQLGSTLTPTEIVRRAQTQACAGCHQLSTSTAELFGGQADANQVGLSRPWPDAALGVIPLPAFTQVSESLLTPLAPGVTCDAACTADPTTCACAWVISQGLSEVFLPFRLENMATYMGGMYWDNGSYLSHTWGPGHYRIIGSPDN